MLTASLAEQLDVHEGTATVREAMRFSAYLRQPTNVSKEEKDAYVEEVIELLELQPLGDALVFTLSVEGKSEPLLSKSRLLSRHSSQTFNNWCRTRFQTKVTSLPR